MGTVIVLIGEVAPLVAEMLLPGGDDGGRSSLDAVDRAPAGSPGVDHLALVAGSPGQLLHDGEIAPVIAWVEARCGGPAGLTRVATPVASTFLRVLVECDLASALRRRGRRLVLIVGRGVLAPAAARTVRDCLMTLANQGIDTVGLTSRDIPPWCRRVAEPEIAPALRAAGQGGMSFSAAAFGPAEAVAAVAGVEQAEAAALQLQLVERAASFRAALWTGARAPLDARLAARAVALRRQGASGPAAGPPSPGLPRADKPSSPAGLDAVVAFGADGMRLEMRPARSGEAIALVPVFDPVRGTSALIPMSSRAAAVLHPPRPPATPTPPPPSGLRKGLRWIRPRR